MIPGDPGPGTATPILPEITLVMVTYRSSAVAGAAISSFRDASHAAGLRDEVVIVDHSDDAGEVARLRALRPDGLLIRENRGYASGVNAGVAHARGRTILAGNADIRFAPGSVAALAGALTSGWGIVGPQFGLGEFLFPPADVQTPVAETARWLAGRSVRLWHRHIRREMRRYRRLWEAADPVVMPVLSGALLAAPREVFDRVGPWDEGYFLYFEETDWLRRAAAAGVRVGQVPQARVEHVWGQAADPSEAGGHYAASRRRFFGSNFGWRGRLSAGLRLGRTPLRPEPLPTAADSLPDGDVRWLLSPSPLGVPAAGWAGPAAGLHGALRALAAARHRKARYLVLAVGRASDRVLGQWWWEGGGG